MTLWMLGAVFALVGVPMISLAMRTFALDLTIATWPRTQGVVQSSHVESWEQRYRDQDGYDQTRTAARPRVTYTYTVDGRALEGTCIHRNDDTSIDKSAAQRDIDKYPAQRQVSVLYDPSDPRTAYLEVRRSIGGVILFAFGGLWIALGLLLTVLHFL